MARLHKFTNNTDLVDANTTNDITGLSISQNILNLIRMLQDRTIQFSKYQSDVLGEAYTSAAGRLGSVDTARTTATFALDKYHAAVKIVTAESYYPAASSTGFDSIVTNIKIIQDCYLSEIKINSAGTDTVSLKLIDSNGIEIVSKNLSVTTSVVSNAITISDHKRILRAGETVSLFLDGTTYQIYSTANQSYSGTVWSYTSQTALSNSGQIGYAFTKYEESSDPYFIITADNVIESALTVNDCVCTKIDTNKWLFRCTVGSYEVKRAKLYYVMFGPGPAFTNTNLVGVTEIQTSIPRDVGKKGFFADHYVLGTTTVANASYTGTFTDTTTNLKSSVWSWLSCDTVGASASVTFGGSTVNSASLNTVSEWNTDTSSEEKDNPATIVLNGVDTSTTLNRGYSQHRVIVLASGSINWAYTLNSGTNAGGTQSNINFNATYGIPAFSALTDDIENTVEMVMPVNYMDSTISSALGQAMISDLWENGNDIKLKFLKRKLVSTPTYNYGYVGTQVTMGYHFRFSADGTKLYCLNMLGTASSIVYQYTVNSAFDIRTIVYASKSFVVGGQDTRPFGLDFSSDGTKMYILGENNNTIYQYTLSTPWDVSTASYASKSYSVATQTTTPYGLKISSDGTKAFITNGTAIGGYVYSYNLGTAWDISTASYSSSLSFNIAPGQYSLDFSSDGTKMYLGYNSIYQYNLGTAWDITTATITSSVNFSDANVAIINGDGTKLYYFAATRYIYQANLINQTWTLDNGGILEETDWINVGKTGLPETFTTTTNVMDRYQIKLIPKSSSPTPGYPAIYGAGFYAD